MLREKKGDYNIMIGGEVEQVSHLGSIKTSTPTCTPDIKARVIYYMGITWKRKRRNIGSLKN